jgi:branched-subunit amino acid aminotransferase/4-amino-4-deoxychorismate lyase
MATVFLNGRFVSRDEAVVSAFDAGFQHGVGLFETMLAVRDEESGEQRAGWRVLHVREHLERLSVSARGLGLSESLRLGALEEAVVRTVEHAGEEIDAARLRVRLTITGGDLNMLGAARQSAGSGGEGESIESGQPNPGSSRGGEGGQAPTLLIVAQPATEYPAEMFERGVGVVLADLRVNPLDPFQGHKTLNYWPRLRELQVAAGKRAAEALVFQVTNHLAGGCVSNAFVVRGGKVYTPIARGEEEEVAGVNATPGLEDSATPSAGAEGDRRAVLPSPVLPGIVRRWVMDWCVSEGVEVERRMLTIDDVLGADEVLLTNSSWGVLPVVRVEREAIGDGVVGEISKRLVRGWSELAVARLSG